MSNKNIGLAHIAMSLLGLLACSHLYDQGGILTHVVGVLFGFAMVGLLVDGLLIFHGKKPPD